ncbi:sensor histidine kinase [Umezawaea tangerina]|uniref:histidine kinase n=1 Tax=Umezawaea tangerina TaxID=84725 RepID=A0A2T0T470_9PSEU|nr:histidine kinase [Umezawaea tangerina]PRY40424.1 signal transduction histidine kinase [Umezawaea tangerina]
MKNVVERLREWAGPLARPTGPPPLLTRRGQVFDLLVALFIGVATVVYAVDRGDAPANAVPTRVDIVPAPGGSGWIGVPAPSVGSVDWGVLVVLAVLSSVALVVRRRYPFTVLCVVTCLAVLTPPDTPRVTFYACVVAAYSAAAYSQYRLPTLGTLLVMALAVSEFTGTTQPVVPNQYIALMVLVPMVVAANGLRTWKLRTDEGLAQVSTLERERDEALRRAVEHERARIARELHDVVTHNVSVMVIQAGAARKVMAAEPEQAREALLAVEAGGRAAMSELRHVMGLLTMDTEGAEPVLAPQPDVDQLEALVARIRDTGVPVRLTVSGTPRPLPSGVGLAAYRVVQEALTNTVKHAVGASADVLVDYGADRLLVEVTDVGGQPGGATAGSGRGLIGLRERLAVYGGTLRAGLRPLGSYRVTATIPLEAL